MFFRVIVEYFKLQRQAQYRDPSRTTVRLLESISRLAQGKQAKHTIMSSPQIQSCFDSCSLRASFLCFASAHARIMFRNSVTTEDAVAAVLVMDNTMQVGFSQLNQTGQDVCFPPYDIMYSVLSHFCSARLFLDVTMRCTPHFLTT